MSGVKRLFVSDLHLSEPSAPVFRAFERLLADAAGRVDEVYLLGDLCEVWVGDDDDGPLARALAAVLARTAARSRVQLMHGNRDFLFGHRFAQQTGVRLIDDPHQLDDGILLAHGDAFCTADDAYQRLRRQIRSADWQRGVLARPVAERQAMAAALRAESRAANAGKADDITDVSPDAVARAVHRHGARTLIHGHTHRPGIHPEAWGRRYVLGAWERCGWKLEQDGDTLALTCFPIEPASPRLGAPAAATRPT